MVRSFKLIKNETPAQVFSYEYCEIFQSSFFAEDVQVIASADKRKDTVTFSNYNQI